MMWSEGMCFFYFVQQSLFSSAGRLALQRPSITKTGQFLKDYFTVPGFTFQQGTAKGWQEWELWETRMRWWVPASNLWHSECTLCTHLHNLLNLDQDRKLHSFPATWSYSKHSRNQSAWFTLISPVMCLRWRLFQLAEVNQAPLNYFKYLKLKWHC